MSNGLLSGGSIRVLWDADDNAEVTITGGSAEFTVNGSAVVFPYTLSDSTTFTTINSGQYEVSVKHHGVEVADTPDSTRTVVLNGGVQHIFAPSPDSGGSSQSFLGDLNAQLSATFATLGTPTHDAPGFGLYFPEAHGAVRDGTTNDTPAIQAAIDAAATAGGGNVHLAAGTYGVGTFVSLKDKVNLTGLGQARTFLKALTGLTVGVIVGTTANSVSDLTVRDLTVEGDYATTALSIAGMQITGGARVVVDDVTVQNIGKQGILLQTGTNDSTVRGCRVDQVGLADAANGFGIAIVGGSLRCKVLNNRIIGARGMGIGANNNGGVGSTDCLVSGNYIDMTGSPSYEAIGFTAGCDRAAISNNRIVNSQDNGISVSCSDSTVTGNTINGAINHGIALLGNSNTCTGNVCKNAGKEASADTFSGIALAGSNNVVTGNRCYDDQGTKTQDYGVKEYAGDFNLIVGNILRGNLTAATTTVGVNTLVASNVV